MTSDPHTGADLLVRASGEPAWLAPTISGYPSEKELQSLIADTPSLIPGVSTQARSARELSTGIGPADVVIVDTDGSITIVECKLNANPEVRRTIVGQVFDYASRLSEMSFEDFAMHWRGRAGEDLGTHLTAASEGVDDPVGAVSRNLSAGSFRLVLAVDRINDDLRRIVRYLNTHTGPGMRILAMELRRAQHGGLEILIPSTYGSESADTKEARTSSVSHRWKTEDVEIWLAENDPALVELAAQLRLGLEAVGLTTLGGEARTPSLVFRHGTLNGDIWPVSVSTSSRGAMVTINFDWMHRVSDQVQSQLLDDLCDAGLDLDSPGIRAAGYRKRPSIPLGSLRTPGRLDAVIRSLSRLAERVA